MSFEKYARCVPLVLRDRTWPNAIIDKAPLWCSVDLRDGNQALIDPMDPDRKRRMFDAVVAMGFKEIEVGFPAASQPDFDFIRQLVDRGPDPRRRDDPGARPVPPGAARAHATSASLQVAPRAIVHFYNSTNPLQRRVVFGLDKQGIVDIAVNAARLCRKLGGAHPGTGDPLRVLPGSFTLTEPDFAVEVCERVMDIIEPDAGPADHPQPAGDRRVLLRRTSTATSSSGSAARSAVATSIVLSLHPHNDRGCAVAAAEFGIMAGADRVEGTLFGNGERTGNLDVVNVAMNLFANGVDPELDVSDIDALRRVAEYCNRLPVPPGTRTPATSSTPRSAAATRTPSRRGSTPCPPTTTSGACRTCRSTPSTSVARTRR